MRHASSQLPACRVVLAALGIGLFSVLSPLVFAAEPAPASLSPRSPPEVWIMPPPWPGNGQPLREMLQRPGEWQQVRQKISGMGYWPWLLNQHFHDQELRALFAGVRTWNLKLGFEVPVLKAADWGGDSKPLVAKGAFDQLQGFATRFTTLGMEQVDWFAFDEPLYAARHVISFEGGPTQRLAYGVAETTAFVGLMRRAYPQSRLGLIEPFPALSLEELVHGVESVQRTCAEQGFKGLDFLRLDVDWDRMDRCHEGSWADVKRIEERCRAQGIAFSLIYWSADEPRLAKAGPTGKGSWRSGILKQQAAYARAGGRPDEIVIESWLHIPEQALPETDPDTFTGSVLEFLGSCVDMQRQQ